MAEVWSIDYNHERQHKALSYLSPVKYAEQKIKALHQSDLYPQTANGNPPKIGMSRLVDKAE